MTNAGDGEYVSVKICFVQLTSHRCERSPGRLCQPLLAICFLTFSSSLVAHAQFTICAWLLVQSVVRAFLPRRTAVSATRHIPSQFLGSLLKFTQKSQSDAM